MESVGSKEGTYNNDCLTEAGVDYALTSINPLATKEQVDGAVGSLKEAAAGNCQP